MILLRLGRGARGSCWRESARERVVTGAVALPGTKHFLGQGVAACKPAHSRGQRFHRDGVTSPSPARRLGEAPTIAKLVDADATAIERNPEARPASIRLTQPVRHSDGAAGSGPKVALSAAEAGPGSPVARMMLEFRRSDLHHRGRPRPSVAARAAPAQAPGWRHSKRRSDGARRASPRNRAIWILWFRYRR